MTSVLVDFIVILLEIFVDILQHLVYNTINVSFDFVFKLDAIK